MNLRLSPAWLASLLLTTCWCLAGASFSTTSFATTGFATTNNTLTVELVRQRLQTQAVKENAAMAQVYQSVAGWLDQAVAHQQNEASYNQQAASAATRVAEFQARLDKLVGTSPPDTSQFSALSLEQLDLRLAEERANHAETGNELDALDRKIQSREVTAQQIQTRLNEINRRLPELSDTEIPINRQAKPSLLEAAQWSALAEKRSLEAERRALNAKLISEPTRYTLLQVQQAALTERLDLLAATIDVLEAQLNEREESGERLVNISISPDRPAYPVAEALAQDYLALRRERSERITARHELSEQSDDLLRQTRLISERFSTTRRIVSFAGDSDALGHVLMTHWLEIHNYKPRDPTSELGRMIGNTVISRINHEEALAELANGSSYIAQQLANAGIEPQQISAAERASLIRLVQKNREQLSVLISSESTLIDTGAQLRIDYQRLSELVTEYRNYLASLILWTPSHPHLYLADFAGIPEALKQLIDTRPDIDLQQLKSGTLLTLLAALVLLLYRRRFKQQRRAVNEKVHRPRADRIGYTLIALALTLLLTLPLPLLLICVSDVFATGGNDLSQAIAHTLDTLFVFISLPLLLRYLCDDDGVGRVHFSWPPPLCDRLSHEARLLLIIGAPLEAITLLMQLMELDNNQAALSRLLYMAVLCLLLARIIWLLKHDCFGRPGKPTVGTPFWLYAGAAALSGTALAATTIGHVYSVNVLLNRSLKTLALGIALAVLYGLLLRWLQIARRRMRMAELIAHRSGTSTHESAEIDNQVGLNDLSDATTQLLRAGILVAGIVALIYLWAPIIPMLTALDQFTLWSTETVVDGEPIIIPITLQTLVIVLFLAVATFYAARKLPALIELVLRQRTRISASARYTVITLINYLIVATGLVLALGALGLKWSQLQWLVAALGVGIGFGLQEIVANFISGLIILFERPIRVGDVVTVGGQEGTVKRIRIRATTIRDWNGKELLVPNKDFITGQLLNWTLSDQVTRIVINVGVTYGSDVERALTQLQAVIDEHPDILDNPASRVLFTELGDNALILVIRCFIDSVDDRMKVISELHRAIYARLNAAGIEFAFPQLDVHLDKATPEPPAAAVHE